MWNLIFFFHESGDAGKKGKMPGKKRSNNNLSLPKWEKPNNNCKYHDSTLRRARHRRQISEVKNSSATFFAQSFNRVLNCSCWTSTRKELFSRLWKTHLVPVALAVSGVCVGDHGLMWWSRIYWNCKRCASSLVSTNSYNKNYYYL